MAKSKPKSTSRLHEAARTLGEAGGKKGGPARARALTAAQRKKIATQGGKASKGKK